MKIYTPVYAATCNDCHTLCWWQSCPTGGWWIHDQHPDNGHDANPGWQPLEIMDIYGHLDTAEPVDTAIAHIEEGFDQDWFAFIGIARAINTIGDVHNIGETTYMPWVR